MTRERGIGRRPVRAALAGALIALIVAVAGCGNDAATTASPSAAPVKAGGVLKVGIPAGAGELDPVLSAGAPGDVALQQQVLEPLVSLGRDSSVQPVLATKWASDDGKTWTFTLREDVTFSNGKAFTADDVVYTMERLRSRELGSPMADVYANISSVASSGAHTVTFVLAAADAEFPASLTDHRAVMLCARVKDPAKRLVGTGPFILRSLRPGERAVLRRNPDYWGVDAAGAPLPYLDGLDLRYSDDAAGQVRALLGGSLHVVMPLRARATQAVQAGATTKTLITGSPQRFALQIRTDQGPGADLALRQAIMAGTDRQAIADVVAPGVAVPGNGTLVGPASAAAYLPDPGTYDPERARQLLAEAGYAAGTEITLVIPTIDAAPAIATAWQAQMSAIGITVKSRRVSPDVFYADAGDDTWQAADFCIVDYDAGASPLTALVQALTSEAPWNFSGWTSTEFDELVGQIPRERDDAKRADLYRRAQTVLRDQVPILNLLVMGTVAGTAKDVEGIQPAPDWSQTLYRTAHVSE